MYISAHTPEQLELLWNALYTGMPRLEDLGVCVSDSAARSAGPRKLSAEDLPRLTRLTLPARLFCQSWPNTLQALALRSHLGNDESAFDVMESLDIDLISLENYPSLRVLDVRDITLFQNPYSRPPPRTFPTLELLRIRSQWDTISSLLPLLTFPPSTRVEIRIDPKRLPPLQRNLLVPGTALDTVAALIDHVAISSGPISTIRGLIDGSERLRITGNFDEWSVGQVSEILRLFERSHTPVSRLLLAQHPTQRMPRSSEGWLICLAFPHVTHLTLHGRLAVCAAFIRALSPPVSYYAGSEQELPSLPHLKDLTVGVGTKRHSAMSVLLRRGDVARQTDGGIFVRIHFRECCRLFPRVLEARGGRGYRLSRLEFFSYEEGCMARPSSESVVSHVDLAAYEGNLVDRELAPLRALVDGPVVFSGYRFFKDADECLSEAT
ncbi:hypothetical protein GSI_04522 [Ganoderma sinense ZZ0214-1]|uniref:F-box domain-containing protein n=1 Tax=Ganoderma sinense ZZ0214-1 TaxID=1077348 RepID=A0A2G8SH34_9APHY|nr:hypothetical protein GSI_04522 [Ganoderma sinense ZZ0214-1]